MKRAGTVALLVALLWQGSAAGEELFGTATRVFDGDSFILQLAGGGKVEVRLGEIDAPEKEQPYAGESRAALRELILDRKLRAVVIDVDSYQRKVARVYRLETVMDVNAQMIERGHAWVYRRWVRDKTLYAKERRAREAKLGLWALPEAARTPPWKWRREQRASRKR